MDLSHVYFIYLFFAKNPILFIMMQETARHSEKDSTMQ